MMSRKVPIIILFVDMEGEGVQSTLDWFTEVAKENIHRFSFLYAGYIPPLPARVVNPHSPFPFHTHTHTRTRTTQQGLPLAPSYIGRERRRHPDHR